MNDFIFLSDRETYTDLRHCTLLREHFGNLKQYSLEKLLNLLSPEQVASCEIPVDGRTVAAFYE